MYGMLLESVQYFVQVSLGAICLSLSHLKYLKHRLRAINIIIRGKTQFSVMCVHSVDRKLQLIVFFWYLSILFQESEL